MCLPSLASPCCRPLWGSLIGMPSGGQLLPSVGALDGGSPVPHVDFKKCQCCMFMSLMFKNVTCRVLEKAFLYVTLVLTPLSYDSWPYVTCRIYKNALVALLILGSRAILSLDVEVLLLAAMGTWGLDYHNLLTNYCSRRTASAIRIL